MNERCKGLIFATICFVSYVLLATQQNTWFRTREARPLSIVMPAEVQALLAAGDRHLAANFGAFRAVTVGVHELAPEEYNALARLQLSVAKLNPNHEDNYYTAAAILPWNGEYDLTQEILQRATEARKHDSLPPFFLGFNYFYFEKKYRTAAEKILIAAEREKGSNRASLQNIAAKWIEKGEDLTFSINTIEQIGMQSNNNKIKAIMAARAKRINGLILLRAAANTYQDKYKSPPKSLDDLLQKNILNEIPADPIGNGYTIDKYGTPQFKR